MLITLTAAFEAANIYAQCIGTNSTVSVSVDVILSA